MPRTWLCVVFCVSAATASGAQTTSISLALTNGPTIYGVALQVSATVKPTGAGSPTGTVTFVVDGAAFNPRPIDPGGVATVSSSFFPGAHTVTASYGGDTNFLGSTATAPLTFQIAKAATSITMASNPPQIGQPVAIRAAVTLEAGSGIPGGTVDFKNAGVPISGCTGLAASSGVAICNTAFTAIGAVTVTASYSGDSNTVASVGSLPLNIGKVVAGIYIAATPASLSWGMPVTVNVLLLGAQGVAPPTGNVIFSDHSTAIGTQPVGADGRASLVTLLATGTHSVAAAYVGDANYQPIATRTALDLTVAKAATSILLSAESVVMSHATIHALVSLPLISGSTGTVAFSVVGTGPLAGCSAIPISNGLATCSATLPVLGTISVRADYSGDDNNSPSTATITVNAAKLAPGVYLAAQPDAPYYGLPVTLGGLVLGASGLTPPTGSITFYQGGVSLGTQTVGTDGHATLTKALAVGSYTFTMSYSGDGMYQASATGTPPPLTVTVAKAASTMTLAASPAQIGQPVTIRCTAWLTTNSPMTGAVDFTAAAKPIDGCTQVPLKDGAATCNTKFTQLGNYAITALYSGDDNINPGTATMQLTVGKAAASMYLNSTPDAPVSGEAVTVNALVLGADGAPTVTGAVAFADGVTKLGTQPLGSDGRASIVLRLSAGSHSIGATYVGDLDYQTSAATLRTIVVAKSGTSTSLSGVPGAPLVATVTIAAPGTGTPTGTVQFLRGGAVLATIPLLAQNGAFTATWSSPQIGNINATYLGDANFTASMSTPMTVTQPLPRMIVSSDHDPVHPGETVTFTVTVAPASDLLTNTPSGRVALSADGASLGASTLNAGKATFQGTFTKGAHSILAQYSGDTTYAAASVTSSLTVNVDSASLSVTSNQPVTWFGQPVTFTAKLGSPVGGSIQFSEGSTVLGSGTLSVGVATLTASDLPAGTHTITASWPGDTNWSAASAQLVQTVNRANTVTAATISGGVARAVVTAVAPGAGNPGGTVRFVDIANNAVLVSAVLDSGRANFTLPASGNSIEAVYVGDGNFLGSTSAPISQLAAVNAASYGMASVAPDEIVTLFGQNLAGENLSAAQPAATLGGLAVTVTDSTGVSRVTPLWFVSPTQASVLMPPDLATGPAMIRAARSGGVTVSTAITVTRAAPGLFTADGSGEGTPAAQIIRIHADGTREAAEAVTSAPIDLGDPGDVVYLVLYGTGIRHFIAAPTCMIGGQTAAVAFAGAQDSFPGLDQVNVRVPDVMRGAGTVKLTLTVDGIDSNAVTVSFR